jgi:pimeloyl-ACP methyl ester carboxylesterase
VAVVPDSMMVPVRDAEVCAEVFGSTTDPLLLLIAGGASSMDWWDPQFCQRLVDGGRAVVRYDHRDTGASTTHPPGAPGYDGADLCADALAILDALGSPAAHVSGISMGAGIAQQLAVQHPERLASLTLMSSSPAGPGPDNGLPAMAPRLLKALAGASEPDWSDPAAVVDHMVADMRLYAGSAGFDEDGCRRVAAAVVERSSDPAAASNHFMVGGGDDPRPRLGEIAVPTLVIHGTDDPLFPLGHGEALAREIPGAALLVLDGVGHEVPPPSTWDVVVPALLRHTAPSPAA